MHYVVPLRQQYLADSGCAISTLLLQFQEKVCQKLSKKNCHSLLLYIANVKAQEITKKVQSSTMDLCTISDAPEIPQMFFFSVSQKEIIKLHGVRDSNRTSSLLTHRQRGLKMYYTVP